MVWLKLDIDCFEIRCRFKVVLLYIVGAPSQ